MRAIHVAPEVSKLDLFYFHSLVCTYTDKKTCQFTLCRNVPSLKRLYTGVTTSRGELYMPTTMKHFKQLLTAKKIM